MVEFNETFGSATELQIARFESRNRLRLPPSYKQFLMTHNGGHPINDEFAVPGWGCTSVQYFFGLQTGDSYDLQDWTTQLRCDELAHFLPIAVDGGGWVVFLRLGSSADHGVYFIDTKSESRYPIKIATDFPSFLDGLMPTESFDHYVYGRPPA